MAEAASISRILMVVSIVVTRLTVGLVISANLCIFISMQIRLSHHLIA